ncbi:MAG: hypothetical protein AAF636_26025 [Pseudomonadota bacterium]
MALKFDNIASNLIPGAQAVGKYLSHELGVTKIKSEQAIDDNIMWVPTISGIQTDHHLVYVDVTDAGLSFAMSRYLATLMQAGLPALIYVAVPDSASDAKIKTYVEAASLGLGILQVSANNRVKRLRRANSTSLLALRPVNPKEHRAKYRQALADAQETFLNGDPVGGCQRVHQEVEALSRIVCKATFDKGLWSSNQTANVNWDTGAWKRILTLTTKSLDTTEARKLYPGFNDSVLYTVAGLPDRRNSESHKPKTKGALMKRDRLCRTAFESAVDTFAELQETAKSLKLR